MMAPKIPENECERLKDLFEYEVLDSSAENNFNELVELAAIICEVPIALISLVDENRQWFKAKIGIETVETSRNLSFCGHALHSTNILEITNTLLDDRFKDNPLVTSSPHIRYYAGAPLITPHGTIIGTLCVIDKVPRKLTEIQKKGLKTLATQAMDLLELRRSNKNITKLNETLSLANHRITQQQDALVQSAKLQTMGAVASGIYYELGNPITSINGRLKMLMDATEQEKFDKQVFSEGLVVLDKNIQRLERMMKTLGQFTQDDDLLVKKIDVHDLMHDLMTLIRERFNNSGIKLLFDLPGSTIFKGPYNQVSQVLINLLHNAFDAVHTQHNGWVKITVHPDNDEVVFRITDSGKGLTDEARKRLFEPFFTTKSIGRGIGLSLYISRGIVENHHGQLFLDESARETTFVVIFPR